MLVLDGKTIEGMVDPKEMVNMAEAAFRIFKRGSFTMPERYGVEKDGRTLLYMPCFTEEFFGTKILTLIPENRQRGLPSIDGMVILNDKDTGEQLAVMDGKSITAWRTAAVGAFGASRLAYAGAECVGIVGCGVQGMHQAVCICAVRGIKRVALYDKYKDLSLVESELKKLLPAGTECVKCASAAELLRCSDIVVTTTFSNEPVLPDDAALLKGKCYIAVGSYKPYMHELPDGLFSLADRVYVDLMHACEESGDIITPLERGLLRKDDIHLIHELLEGGSAPQPGATAVFKTVGMALMDIYAAGFFYKKALELGIGQRAEL